MVRNEKVLPAKLDPIRLDQEDPVCSAKTPSDLWRPSIPSGL